MRFRLLYPAIDPGSSTIACSFLSSFARDPALKQRLETCHSSCLPPKTAPASRVTDPFVGEIPTTLVLLLTSLSNRSDDHRT